MLACCALLPFAARAQTVAPAGAVVVSTCGTSALPAGSADALRIDTTGNLCTTTSMASGSMASGNITTLGSVSDVAYPGSNHATINSLLQAIYEKVSKPVLSSRPSIGRIQVYNDAPHIVTIRALIGDAFEGQYLCPGQARCVFNDGVAPNGAISVNINNEGPKETARMSSEVTSFVIPVSGTIDRLYYDNKTATVMFVKNGAPTSLTCSVGNGVSSCSDTTSSHAVPVAAGDTIEMKYDVHSNTATATQVPVSIGYAMPKSVYVTRGYTIMEVLFFVLLSIGATTFIFVALTQRYWPWSKNEVFSNHIREEINQFDKFTKEEERASQEAEFNRFKHQTPTS